MSKIALVHDYFIQMGGAERVAMAMHDSFPSAPIYTTVALQHRLPQQLRVADIRTSAMQSLPGIERRFREYFMLYPFAVEHFDLSQYDLIFSSSSGYAKGVRRRRDAIHVCYCHTPMRWVWRYEDYVARESFGGAARSVLPLCLWGLKKWDLRASQQPNYNIANSQLIADRIKKIYGREAVVIPPPIDVDRFQPSNEVDDYYLVLSRLMPYKRIDLAVEACKRMDRRLIVIGDGPDRARLEKLAGPKTEFLGRQPDHLVSHYASRCRALLFPGEEDFGMVPLEVNAAGRPVIAFRGGGAMETVVEGVTGVFFDRQESDALAEAIEDFEGRFWHQQLLRRHAEKFDPRVFAFRVLQFLSSVAPSSCAAELGAGARLLSGTVAARVWPRLVTARAG
ncbi:MAG TPA: glycosyltransferase [Pyrinomonadaceae bacterium]|nr:glycosyltransferase [Pyrinomonadaceae bacterium]